MIQKLLVLLIHFGPKTKRWFWRVWYNIFAKKAYSHDFFFMNYGYSDENLSIKIDPKEERERYPAALYHHTANQENLAGKKILEVGSGRGGGASYVSRYLNPKSVIGIDISKNAVDLCNSTHQYPNLSFCVGDSEKIPFENESFDVVLNVESSHCYGNIPLFLTEVKRVLKPGGFFLWADFRLTKEMSILFNCFLNSGLVKIREKNITNFVINALKKMSTERKKKIKKYVPRTIQPVFMSYAGIEGSGVYDSFIQSKLIYKSATFKKPK